MPIYEYKCPKCGIVEAVQKVTDEPLRTCPKCGEPLKKVISHGVGIVFKGPGFYTTDNRSEDYKSKAKEGKTDKAAGI
jgi:putative FmdB family regulatory protein